MSNCPECQTPMKPLFHMLEFCPKDCDKRSKNVGEWQDFISPAGDKALWKWKLLPPKISFPIEAHRYYDFDPVFTEQNPPLVTYVNGVLILRHLRRPGVRISQEVILAREESKQPFHSRWCVVFKLNDPDQ